MYKQVVLDSLSGSLGESSKANSDSAIDLSIEAEVNPFKGIGNYLPVAS